IVNVPHLNNFVRRIGRVLKSRALNRRKLRRSRISNFRVRCRGCGIQNHRCGDLCDEHGILGFVGSGNGSEDGACWARQWNISKINWKAQRSKCPGALQTWRAKPASGREVVIRLRWTVEEDWTVGVTRENKLRARNGRVGGLSVEENDFGGTGSVEDSRDNGIGDLRRRNGL